MLRPPANDAPMNRLSTERRGQVIACLVEGMSIRSTVWVTGVAKNTIVKLLVELGDACAEYQDRMLRNLPCDRFECDEIWSFCYAKAKNVPIKHEDEWGCGDVWTWTSIDAETKLVPSWLVGRRDNRDCYTFLADLKSRLRPRRVQITTDGLQSHLTVIEPLFGADRVDYAQLIKMYGGDADTEHRYSPATCTGIDQRIVTGFPNPECISTSYVERQNLTMRMSHAPVHPLDQWVLQEGREPHGRDQPLLHALQLRPAPRNPDEAVWPSDHSGLGGRGRPLSVVSRRNRQTSRLRLTHYRKYRDPSLGSTVTLSLEPLKLFAEPIAELI